MAWNAPRTWVAGELATHTMFNEMLRDNQNVLITPIKTTNGKINALTSTELADLSGANLTGVALTASANTYTAGKNNFNGGANVRFLVPVGADKWAT